MLRLIWKLYWRLGGWKIAGSFPYQHTKMVLIIAPHTHWQDLFVGFAARHQLKITHAKFLGKKELFTGPLGWLLRRLGGTPVDRFSKQGMVEQAAALFAANETFLLAMAPEGTRKRVEKLRSGFYHIAKQAQVPILPIGFDFENKQVIIGELIFTSADEAANMKKIIAFYSVIKGKKPDRDLRHLK